MGTASHAMWSPALAGSQEPRWSVAPLKQVVRDGLRLAVPVAATAIAVAALAAPTTAGLDDLSTWVPNAISSAPAGPGAATAGPAGDGNVTVRINKRAARPAADGVRAVLSAPFADGPTNAHPDRVSKRVAPKPVAPRPHLASPSGPPAPAAPAAAAPVAPAPAALSPATAPAPTPAPSSTKRSAATAPAKAKPKSATTGSPTTDSTETSFTAASSGSSAPAGERKGDKTPTKAEKADGKQAKNDR